MIRNRYFILVIVFFLFNLCSSLEKESTISTAKEPSPAVKKLALIVAIGNYPTKNGWSSLASANDISLVKVALQNHGFAEKDILVVKDKEATKKEIIEAFEHHLLNQADQNDIVVFHYSGHGQQIPDNNQDEADGLDEALVAYNAPMRFIKGKYEGENHLRDDEIGDLLQQLRQKLGPDGNVLVTIDACYSGTATRDGLSRIRGSVKPLAPEGYQPVRSNGEELTGLEYSADGNGLASMVVISGARQDESNKETQDANNRLVGSLSLALSRQLQFANRISYQEFYERIREDMATTVPNQTPQIEGDVEKYVFSGETSPNATTSIVVETVNNASEVEISAGLLAGIREGATVAFYENNADPANAQPVNTGTVTKSNIVFATVTLDKNMAEKKIKGKKVFFTSFGTGSLVTRVGIQMFTEKEFGNRMKQVLGAMPAVDIVQNDPELMLTDSTFEVAAEVMKVRGSGISSKIRLYDRNARDLLSTTEDAMKKLQKSNPDTLEELIQEKLSAFHAAKVFTSIETHVGENQQPGISLSVVPVKYEKKDKKLHVVEELPLSTSRDGGNKAYMNKGEVFLFRLKNNTNRTLYYNVLQMDADRNASVLIPNKKSSPTDRFLKPGEEKLIKDTEYFYRMSDPLGPQQFKAVATDRAFYLGDDLERLQRMSSRSPEPLLSNFTYITVDNEVIEITAP